MTTPRTFRDRVAVNIRAMRAGRRWSAQELANRSEKTTRPISRRSISQIEAGSRDVSVDDLMALAQAFDVPAADLLAEAPICRQCSGQPPEGFACLSCGTLSAPQRAD